MIQKNIAFYKLKDNFNIPIMHTNNHFKCKKGISLILFTDEDITWTDNAKLIGKLLFKIKKPFAFNIFMATKKDYSEFVRKIRKWKYMTTLDN